MSDEKHVRFLRSFTTIYPMNREAKESILEAADYIEELEGQIRIMNRLGNIDSSPGLVERVAALEAKMSGVASKMDLENLHMQIMASRQTR